MVNNVPPVENKDSAAFTSAAIVLFIELVAALVVIIFVLGILNFFGVVRLSTVIPIFSFLPTSENAATQRVQTVRVGGEPEFIGAERHELIQPKDSFEASNTGVGYRFDTIENSFAIPKSSIRIDVSFSVETSTATGSSGLSLNNNLPYNDPNFRSLGIYYYADGGNWLLQDKKGENSEYYFLFPDDSDLPYINASIIIHPEGNKADIVVPGIERQTIELVESLYVVSREMNITTSTAPQSILKVYSLYYEY